MDDLEDLGLGPAGAAFYESVHGDAEAADEPLSLPAQEALFQASQSLDTIAALERGLAETGPVLDGRPSPLVAELRLQRAGLVRLLGMLPDSTRKAATGKTRAARAASRARWGQGGHG